MRYAIVLAVLIAGCHSKPPEVHTMDDGRYTVLGSTKAQASNGAAIARHNAVDKAAKFCKKQDRAVNVVTYDDGTTIGSYISNLVFTCK